MSTVLGAFHTILFQVNSTIYKFIGILYSFTLNLAGQSNIIIQNTELSSILSKLYVFVGLLMLFRLAFMLIHYIADPDAVVDKKKGVGRRIVPHLAVVIFLLIMMPTFFSWAYKIQDDIFNSGFLTAFFTDVGFRGDQINFGDENKKEEAGALFADSLLLSFITPCSGSDGANNKCGEQMNRVINGIQSSSYPKESEDGRVDHVAVKDFIAERDSGNFRYSYNGFISIVVAIVVIVMLTATTFKIALRIFNLLALEIIAPIPIIMYIDPTVKQAESKSALENWVVAVVTTYLDVFIRMLFVGFMAATVSNIALYLDISVMNPYVLMQKIFVIFGALLFMNFGPDFIMGLFNKKAQPGSFNPFKQMSSMPYIGQAVSGTTMGTLLGAPLALAGGVRGAAYGVSDHIKQNGLNAKGMLQNVAKHSAAGAAFQGKVGFSTGMRFAAHAPASSHPIETYRQRRDLVFRKQMSNQGTKSNASNDLGNNANNTSNTTNNSNRSAPHGGILDKSGQPISREPFINKKESVKKEYPNIGIKQNTNNKENKG